MTPQSARAHSPHTPQILRANLALLAMSWIWALNFSIAKEALSSVPALAFNTLRFPLAALVVTVAMAHRGGLRLPDPADRWRFLALGMLGNLIYQMCFILGLANTRAGTASVLLSGTPIVTALLAAAVGQEHVGRRVWIGATATLTGIIVVVVAGARSPAGGETTLLGELLLIGATFAWAIFAVGSRGLIVRYGALPVTAWTLWAGSIGICLAGLPATLAMDLRSLDAQAWFAIVYAGALSIGVAYVLWSYGVRHLGPTRTSTYSNLVPVFALLGAWVLLGERPSIGQFLGAAIIITGVTLAQTQRRRESAIGVRTPPP
jgi:drug/metabolite transporter (DMT)-like permease